MELQGKSAIVTGAASGLGMAIAEVLSREGASVVVSDVDASRAKEVAKLLPQAIPIPADVSSKADVERLFSRALSSLGRLDILVTAAGICSLTKIPDINEEEWDRMLAINLKGTFLCCQAALREMVARKSGKVVTISSASAKIGGVAVGAHYSASKAGIICLTKSMALYAAPYHVNVNCVSPGPMETPMTEAWGEEINRRFRELIPWKEYGKPRDVAEAVLFLVSDQARYITGEILDVNGGLVMD